MSDHEARKLAIELSKLPLVTVENVVEITPALAERLLTLNHENRHLSEKRVELLVGALQRGEWRVNGDTISISSDWERLLNGQHRLHAVVASGISIHTFIAVVDDVAQVTMDRGRTRSFADYLQMNGYSYATSLATIIGSLWAYETFGWPTRQSSATAPTIEQLIDVLQRHTGVIDSIRAVGMKPGPMSATFAATHHYIFSQVDKADAEQFFERLRTGVGMTEGDPVLTLRERLIKEREAVGTIPIRTRSAFMFMAFNAFRQGAQLKKLAFRNGGANPQDFPTLWQ